MKPLVFLTVRTFVNGVKRALTSPQRLIGLLVVLGYYANFILRALGRTGGGSVSRSIAGQGMLEFHTEYVAGISFALFALLSFFLFLGSFNPRGGFRPADVDVLFATPVEPKAVLVFRIVRDYLLTLLLPLFFAFVTGPTTAGGYQYLFKNFPEQGRLAGKMFSISYLLLSLTWVCIGYAISLFINRSDEQSDRNKKAIDVSVFVVALLVMGYVGVRLRQDLSWETGVSLTQSPFLRIVFFPATAASWILMAPFDGSIVEGIGGAITLIAIIGLSLHLAMTQVGFLYDQAAAKGFATVDTRKLQRSGDTYGIVAERARRGRVKSGRLSRAIGRLRFKGGAALLWKELLLQTRGSLGMLLFLGPMMIFMVLMPVYATGMSERTTSSGYMLLGMLGFMAFIISQSTGTGGFIELLRRVDFQKPLPFSPTVTVFWEVAAKVVPIVALTVPCVIGAIAINPALTGAGLAGIVMTPALSLVLTAVNLLVIVLFPDIEDAAQRGFRGLMLLLGSAICILPSLGVAVAMFYFKVHPLVVAIPFTLVNVAIAVGVSAIAGGFYSSFNPSE